MDRLDLRTAIGESAVIATRTIANGLTLAVEENSAVQSCALSWLVPAGTATDPEGDAGEGRSALMAEFMLRGAGRWESRAHSDALDALGIDRRSSASTHHLVLSATLLSNHLLEALPLLAPILTAPRLDPAHLDAVRRLALQSLDGLEDEPQHLAMVRVSERFFPPPFNRSGYGTRAGLMAVSMDEIGAAWRERIVPRGSILAMAGRVDIDAVAKELERLLADWHGTAPEPRVAGIAAGGTLHVPLPSAQAHLALALWGPPESSEHALEHRLAIRILGGETSSRLFIEVREKRGLCYSVGAGTSLGRDRGITTIYAGSTPDRAETTLRQIRMEVDRFMQGVTQTEFDRAVTGFKSRLVMQGESTSARAAAIAIDMHRRGRPRTLDELAREVDALHLASVNDYVRGPLAAKWRDGATLVVVGPTPVVG